MHRISLCQFRCTRNRLRGFLHLQVLVDGPFDKLAANVLPSLVNELCLSTLIVLYFPLQLVALDSAEQISERHEIVDGKPVVGDHDQRLDIFAIYTDFCCLGVNEQEELVRSLICHMQKAKLHAHVTKEKTYCARCFGEAADLDSAEGLLHRELLLIVNQHLLHLAQFVC